MSSEDWKADGQHEHKDIIELGYNSLLTVGTFLLTVELFYLRLCLRAFLHTIEACYRHIRTYYLSNSKHFKTVTATVFAGKFIEMTFKMVIGNRWK